MGMYFDKVVLNTKYSFSLVSRDSLSRYHRDQI